MCPVRECNRHSRTAMGAAAHALRVGRGRLGSAAAAAALLLRSGSTAGPTDEADKGRDHRVRQRGACGVWLFEAPTCVVR